jgi:penicillin-binding protein 1B
LRIRLAPGFWTSKIGLAILGTGLFLFVLFVSIFAYYYIQFGKLINQHLTGQIYQNTSQIFSAPGHLITGEPLKPSDLATYMLRAGYQEGHIEGAPGEFKINGNSVDILPSQSSFFKGGNAVRVNFSAGKVSKITEISTGTPRDFVDIEPELVTNLFDSTREKRRIVRFDDLPKIMVNAVLAAEDKRFFEHGGLDFVRVFGAAWADLRRGQKAQGASTLDMQVARSFFFDNSRNWKRKVKEVLMATEIDQRFTKQQIFEMYANEIYIGNRGSFAIRGFGEAAPAYFGKDLRDITLGEAAFLAAIIRQPNHYSSAERHPDRAEEARDRVLGQMVEDGYITQEQSDEAKKQKLKFVNGGVTGASAPYFVDMVKDHLLEHYSEADLQTQSFRVYTSLDPALQKAAESAIATGAINVDKLLAKKYAAWKKKGESAPQVQLALIAMDPATGEIRALVGGRNYGESQLNHAIARRQPGSVFKPFVYAAAFDNATKGLTPVVTPATTVEDVPTTFEFDGKEYTPDNYGAEFYGTVTVRDALIHSLNVATVRVAELIGYRRVVDLSRQMGLGGNIQATPSVALGAYEMTPVDVASGYTAFATGGTRAEPLFLRSVFAADGSVEETQGPRTRPVLDPRVAYLTTSLMEDVIDRGTGASVRAMGFTAPAAGKTGTSRDGWFAGFTSNLICVIWVGFDDNRDLGLSGSAAAAPIWGNFMKQAIALPEYHNVQPFEPPDGVLKETIDPQSGQLATASCPTTVQEYFVAGSEPTQLCELHGGRSAANPAAWLGHLFGKGDNSAQPANAQTGANPAGANGQPTDPNQPATPEKKKGILDKVFGIFGSSKKPADPSKPPPQ